jgi:PKD repeat protein
MTIYRLLALGLVASIILLLTAVGCDKLVTENNNSTIVDSTLGIGCFDCHTDTDNKLLRPRGQFDNSKHADFSLLDAVVDQNGGMLDVDECGNKCHTHEGFLKTFDSVSISGAVKYSAITCFTCHMPHTGAYGQWNADTLRAVDAFVLLKNNQAFNEGNVNMCAHCHQSNMSIQSVTGETNYSLTSDFGPHYSGQADMIIGQNAFRFGDTTTVTNPHAVDNSCTKCHYGTGQGYLFGEHTFRLEDKSTGAQYAANCNVAGCHASSPITDFYVSSVIDSVKMLGDSLESLLKGENVLDPSDTAGRSFFGDSVVKVDEARLLYNYLLYKLDGSRGVHNPEFAKRMLMSSVAKFDSLPPEPQFTVDSATGCAPFTVNFTDLSVGNVLVRIWDFGDGTGTLSAQNPSYTFDTAGTYSVALTVAGIGDSATVTKTDLIHVYDQPIASISADTTYGCVQGGVSFTVQFSTTTTGLNAAYQWDFGDGTVGSTARNPQHAYTSAVPDSFTVSLKVTTDCGEDSTAVTNMIYVDTLAPTAAFSMAPDSVGPGPLTVNFTDESQRARSWSWDFGDGSALSTEQNPQHIFGSAGTYTVQLTVRNGCGEIAKTHTVIVQ